MADLLNCPFCGGTDIRVLAPTAKRSDPYNAADRLYPIVRCCNGCYAECPGDNGDEKGGSAVERWNRRAQDVRGEAMEEAAKICDEYANLTHSVTAERLAVEIRAAAGEPPKEPPPGACE